MKDSRVYGIIHTQQSKHWTIEEGRANGYYPIPDRTNEKEISVVILFCTHLRLPLTSLVHANPSLKCRFLAIISGICRNFEKNLSIPPAKSGLTSSS
jgi:hypothetical protein